MSDVDGGLPPAGWYPDPLGSPELRWWDGGAWTERLAPVPAAQAADPAAPEPEPSPEPSPEPVALSRRELRERVGALTYGEPREPATTVQRSATLVAEQPGYVPFETTWRAEPIETGPWGGTQTSGVWLFVLSPLWAGALVYVVDLLLAGADLRVINIAMGVAVVGFLFGLAHADVTKLKSRGYERTPPLVAVLIPLLYLIIRAVRVRRGGIAPLLTYVMLQVALVAAGLLYVVVIVMPLLSMP